MAIDTFRYQGSGEVVMVKLISGGTIKYGDMVSYLTGTNGFCTASTTTADGTIYAGACIGSEDDTAGTGTKTFPVWLGLTRMSALNAAANDVGKDLYVHDKVTVTGSAEGPKVGVCKVRESATVVWFLGGVASLGE